MQREPEGKTLIIMLICLVVLSINAQTPDCPNILNTDGNPPSGGVCVCNTGYTWNTNVCDADCANDANAASATPQADGTCSCNADYVFDNTLAICQLDCPNIPNTDGTASTDQLTCSCNARYRWNTNVCEVACGEIPYSIVSDGNAGCTCQSKFFCNSVAQYIRLGVCIFGNDN